MYKGCNYILIFLIACSFIGSDPYRVIDNSSFTAGEVLDYRIQYGLVHIGEAKMEVSPALVKVNERFCYSVTLFGRTSASLDLGYKVRNTWRSFIDTSALIPQQFYMNTHENKYRKEETVYFDHLKKTLRSEEKEQATKEFSIPENVQDVISGFYFLRTLDFNQVQQGDLINLPAFYDDAFYDFKVRYVGKEQLKTKFGKINAIHLVPLMPATKLFKGEDPISIWLSDDLNKIPLQVEAHLSVGAIKLELKRMKGVKHPINLNSSK
jgi:hypothetical protein